MEQRPDPEKAQPRYDVGTFLVAGAGVGTLVFAITGNAVWIGLGAALGILVAGVLGAMSQRSRGD